MKPSIKNIALVLTSILLIGACKKDDDKDTVKPTDQSPIAIIEASTTAALLDTVYLDGSSSKNSVSYLWTVSGPAGEIQPSPSQDQNKVYFIPSKAGTYEVSLEVSNGSKTNKVKKQIKVSGAVKIGGIISSSLKLPNLSLSDSCDYFLSEDLIIPAGMSLTIEDGVKICAAEGVAIISEGNLTIENTTIEALGNNWKGIHIKNGDATITGLTIDKAGSTSFSDDSTEKAGIYIELSINKLSNCQFKNSAGYGLVMKKGVKVQNGYFASYSNNASGPAIISLETFSNSNPGANQILSPSSNDYLKLRGGNVDKLSFLKLNVPYQFLGSIHANYISLNLGVKVYVSDTVGITVKEYFIANGTSSDPIIIEGITKAAGSWKGISCKSVNIKYTTIQHAGSSAMKAVDLSTFEYTCGLLVGYAYTGIFAIKNSTISNNKGYGVVSYNTPGYSLNFSYFDNTINNNGDGAILADLATAERIANIQSTYSGYVSQPIITIHNINTQNNTNSATTWKKLSAATSGIDYKFLKGTYVKHGNLTIEKGVFVECDEDVRIEIVNGVTLDAQGTKTEKVVFKGTNSTAGYWDGIYAGQGSTLKLDYVEINYGGGGTGNYKGCLNVDNSVNTTNSFVTNCTFLNGGTYDLYFSDGIDHLGIKDSSNHNVFVNTN